MVEAVPIRAEDKTGDLRGVLPAGTALRGYELKSILGQGAFGITYRARDLSLNRDVAIKEYLPTSLALREGRTTVLPRSPDHAEQFAWGRERFLEEAQTLARLDRTPAIVRVYDFLEANGTAYMVMALIEGETLNKRLMREQRLTPEAVERILYPLLDGLEEVHGIGFLHRDIKPANIMVDAHGRPTLIDFGASRAAMAERSTTITAIFTPGYAAAEQFSAIKLGPWTDIYGLSATLYHAVTGKISPSSIDRILQDTYEPLEELKPEGYAPELLVGIDSGMAIRGEERPQSIAQWRHVLRSGERPVPAIEVTQVERRPHRSRKRGITLRPSVVWSAVAATLLLMAGGGYLAYTASGPPTVGTAALNLSTEQLEQALAERRKADSLAAEKRRLEDEARNKAQAEAEATRQAQEELQRAREARQKVEQELAQLKARMAAEREAQPSQRQDAAAAQRAREEEAAQRKAEAEAQLLRAAEEEARKKADADAEAKRAADEALAAAEAERQRADREAQVKAEAEHEAMRQASQDTQRKAADAERQKAEAEAKATAEAEAAEKSLRLEAADRKRLQQALTAQGFDTYGDDGLIGPRTRAMITAWQKARNRPSTGFLDADQQQALLKEAAPALAKFDERQKTEEEAKARAQAVAAVAPAIGAPPRSATATPYDGIYAATVRGMAAIIDVPLSVTSEIRDGRGTVTISSPGCEPSNFVISISNAGDIDGKGYLNCSYRGTTTGVGAADFQIDGRYRDNGLFLRFWNSRHSFQFTLPRDGSSAVSAASPSVPPAASTRYDGTYSGPALRRGYTGFQLSTGVRASSEIREGRGTVTVTSPGCEPSNFRISISTTGDVDGSGYLNCAWGGHTVGAGDFQVEGRHTDNGLMLRFRNSRTFFSFGLDRDNSAASLAASSSSAPRPATTTAYDGTYSGPNWSKSGNLSGNSRVSASSQIREGRGTVILTSPGCEPSTFRLSLSNAGEVEGSGYLNCTYQQTPNIGAGEFQLDGQYQDNGLRLIFRNSRYSFRIWLDRGSAAVQTPIGRNPYDGLYEGSVTVRNFGTERISIQLVDGSGEASWPSMIKCPNPSRLKLTVAPDGAMKGIFYFSQTSQLCQSKQQAVSAVAENGELNFGFVTPSNDFGEFRLKRR